MALSFTLMLLVCRFTGSDCALLSVTILLACGCPISYCWLNVPVRKCFPVNDDRGSSHPEQFLDVHPAVREVPFQKTAL